MSWIQAVSNIFNSSPVADALTPSLPSVSGSLQKGSPPKKGASKTGAAKKSASPKVSSSVGVRVSKSSGNKSTAAATGNVKVNTGPLTHSVNVKVDDRGKISGSFGQSVQIDLGGHKVRLGGSVGSGTDLQSIMKWGAKLFGT